MTYIIAGNFNNKNFLMVDSISEQEHDLFFSEKLFKLESSDTYCTLSGNGILMINIRLYDEWKFYNNIQPDYESKDTINEIISNTTIDDTFQKNQRLYFLTQEKVFYYDLEFKNGSITNISDKIVIPKNNYVLCHQSYFTPIENNPSNLYSFSSEKIISYNEYVNKEDLRPIYDFKNRFSFVQYDKAFEHKRPFIDMKDFTSLSLDNLNWNDVLKK